MIVNKNMELLLRDLKTAEQISERLTDERNAALRRVETLRAVVSVALAHVTELREAWQTGALHDIDGRGAERSNRNVDVECALREAIAKEVMI